VTVDSNDGTRIACVRSGDGPPLVLVPGVTGDHTHFDFLAPKLEPHFSLWMMQRRGRAQSGDAPEYTIEREYEDVAVVVDEIGGPVDAFGHSFGADVLLGAMRLTANLRRAVIYEPGPTSLPDLATRLDELDALLVRGEREAVIETFYRELVGFSAEDYAAHRRTADFTRDLGLAHTVPREVRASEDAWPPELEDIDIPTLLLVGAESPPIEHDRAELLRTRLRNSQIIVLDGQGHGAIWFDPGLVASLIVDFLLTDRMIP
jgi:pimeloyl-ACP methyl ester carboxylesterase